MEFEPIKYYKSTLKGKVETAAAAYFEELAEEAKIDIGANLSSNQKLSEARSKASENMSALNRCKRQEKTCLISFAVSLAVFITALALTIVLWSSAGIAWLTVTILFALISAALILIDSLYIRKETDRYSEMQKAHETKVEELESECRRQMSPLFSHLDQTDFVKIVNSCVDTFVLNEQFSTTDLEMLVQIYEYKQNDSDDCSVYGVFSGNLGGNPFAEFRTINHRLYNKRYVGHKTIHWTEEERYGDTVTSVSHSETLTASITEPAPEFSRNSLLVYGNDAAPDLSFSRKPSGLGSSPVTADKLEKEGKKKLEKMTKKAITEGGTFQAMANTEFESLFGAYDRDNEVQFRLLFTPLAQQNMTALLKNQGPYGDDFSFTKSKKINIIVSEHSANTGDFEENAFAKETDARELKNLFVKLVNDNFSALYFDLLPILSIPLYSQTKPDSFIPSETKKNVTDQEVEALINHMDPDLFKSKDANIEDQLLKATYEKTVRQSDIYSVISLSYLETPEVDYIPVYGGDGRYHDVPVHYFTYTPERKVTRVCIRNFEGTKKEFSDICDLKLYSDEESVFYKSVVKNRKCLGFVLPENYDYSLEEDQRIDEILTMTNH